MVADALSAPLGQNKPPKSRLVLVLSVPQLLVVVAATSLIGAVGWALVGNGLRSGEQSTLAAAVSAERTSASKPEVSTIAPEVKDEAAAQDQSLGSPVQVAPAAMPPVKTITIIDGTSGKRREVVIPDTAETGGIGNTGQVQRATAKIRPSTQRPTR